MPETALRPQKGAEGLSGGAGKGCYVQFTRRAGSDVNKAVFGEHPKSVPFCD